MGKPFISLLILLFIISCSKKEYLIIDTYYLFKGFENYNVSENLLLTIELANDKKDNKINKENAAIICTIENISDSSEEIILDNPLAYYYNDLKSPIGFFMNVKDYNENIIANEFSVNLLSSNVYQEEPWDRVILDPNEKITVNIKLIDIMGDIFVKKMKEGKYYINVVYIFSDRNYENRRKYISNTLEINIIN
jgi:hypothetical protein